MSELPNRDLSRKTVTDTEDEKASKTSFSEVNAWIVYAQSDLDAANTLIDSDGAFYNHICFHSQQAAEKAIKAGLVFL